MFITVTAISDTDKIEIWKGLHKPLPCPDISGVFNEDTFNNVPSTETPASIKTEEHPIQANLKTCMAEAKGDKQNKQQTKTTVSKGVLEEYNHTADWDLSLLTKKVQSIQKCRTPYFLDPSKPSTIYKETSKETRLRRSSRKCRPIERLMELTALSNDKTNKSHPLALVAGKNFNPNVLNHRDAMKATDRDQFLQAMEEEIERMIEKDIFE
eukprot:12363753-Ditylum_brightwellii.AAC.1